jgi:hypothetical protein
MGRLYDEPGQRIRGEGNGHLESKADDQRWLRDDRREVAVTGRDPLDDLLEGVCPRWHDGEWPERDLRDRPPADLVVGHRCADGDSADERDHSEQRYECNRAVARVLKVLSPLDSTRLDESVGDAVGHLGAECDER